MYADPADYAPRRKTSSLAFVLLLHVFLGITLYKGMQYVKKFTPPREQEVIILNEPLKPQEPPPPPPQQPPQAEAPPLPNVPMPEVPVQPLPDTTISAKPVDAMPATPPSVPGPPSNTAPPATAPGPRTAVLAEGCGTPEYPKSALRNGETGTVELNLLIGPDGKVRDAKLLKTSGSRTLDRAAIEALSLCRFKAAMDNGQAVAAWGRIAYAWHLND
ncbi:energy transducer TonB [Massilia sp. TS11]|uniref:energy transducer TonB n=1 Tax=Massilia sp. TS11 TaxID=2908003 RepID=UPI001EDA3335|nr:energy transducer TonB [Massilia sp. TS11]MCG2584806.1 TonB family protein [Massilia sp. TS11]